MKTTSLDTLIDKHIGKQELKKETNLKMSYDLTYQGKPLEKHEKKEN